MTVEMTQQNSELLESFLIDAWDALSSFESASRELKHDANPERLKEVSILAHRIKGTAALYGHPQTSKLAELAEQLVERGEQIPPEQMLNVSTFMEQVAVCLNGAFERIAAGGSEGDPGIELTNLGGSALFTHLLKESAGAFTTKSVASPSAQSEIQRSLIAELRYYYNQHQEDWEFFEPEALEHIDAIDNALDTVKANGANEDSITTLFRATHTLKGAAYMMSFDTMGDLAHKLEDLMVEVREGERSFDADVLQTLELGSRALNMILSAATGQQTDLEATLADLEGQLHTLLGLEAPEIKDEEPEVTIEPSKNQSLAFGLNDELRTFFDNKQEVWGYFEPEAKDYIAILNGIFSKEDTTELNEEDLSEAFRACHTIKGAAYMVELLPFGDLVTQIEQLLTEIKESDLDFTEIQDLLINGVMVLEKMLRSAEGKENNLEEDWSKLQDELSPFIGIIQTLEVETNTQQATTASGRLNTIRIGVDKLEALMNLAGEVVTLRSRLSNQLGQLNEVYDLLHASRTRMLRTVSEFETLYLNPQLSANNETIAQTSSSEFKRESNTSLQETFAELEFDTYNDLNILSRSVAEMADDLNEIETQLGQFSETFQEENETLQTLARTMRSEVSRARMVPVGQLFSRLRRLLKSSDEKAYKLVVSGETVEIDTMILEEVVDPLLHLVRNALVHGIEEREERVNLGKDPEGVIVLRAFHRGNSVYIEVEDDGAGINAETLKQKALDKGFKTPEEINALSDNDIQQLIFIPGLSTAKELTTDAGRGVGMDVVANSIDKLKGELRVDTTPGLGTKFSIKLPLTLIVSEALMVKVAKQTIAFPADTIETLRHLGSEQIIEEQDGKFILFNGEQIPFLSLHTTLGLSTAPDVDEHAVAVLKTDNGLIAVEVDELLELEEIVVRSLGGILSSLSHLSGATTSSTGEVILILDPSGLQSLQQPQADVLDNQQVTLAAPAQIHRLLLVDDSVSVRRVLNKMLERANYEVVTAGDGQAALDIILQGEKFDAVLTDLEMPRLNGYELIEELRRQPDNAHIPIIVMTSRAGEKHRTLAYELGANDYFAKPIDEAQLLSAVRRNLDKTGKENLN